MPHPEGLQNPPGMGIPPFPSGLSSAGITDHPQAENPRKTVKEKLGIGENIPVGTGKNIPVGIGENIPAGRE